MARSKRTPASKKGSAAKKTAATDSVRVLRQRGAAASKPRAIAAGGEVPPAPRGRARGVARASGPPPSDSARDALLAAFETQELTPTHEFTIAPTPPAATGTTRRRGACARGSRCRRRRVCERECRHPRGAGRRVLVALS